MFRWFLDLNEAAARAINKRLPDALGTDGNYWFQQNVLRHGFATGDVVFDLGGGARPWFAVAEKERLQLRVVGVDISAEELRSAPPGSYDEIIEADVCRFSSQIKADKVICQATLEHVADTAGAIRSIAGVLKPGGVAYIFCPCRNALFAWLNRNLGQAAKIRILRTAFPYAGEGHDGFAAPYDRCVPSQLRRLAEENGLAVVAARTFWVSGYFYVFLPAYLVWRVYQLCAWMVLRDDACETFCMTLRKAA